MGPEVHSAVELERETPDQPFFTCQCPPRWQWGEQVTCDLEERGEGRAGRQLAARRGCLPEAVKDNWQGAGPLPALSLSLGDGSARKREENAGERAFTMTAFGGLTLTAGLR